MDSRVNVTDEARKTVRAQYRQEFSDGSAVSFPADDEKYRVMVFTDIDCPYCRKLHREMDAYHEQGITVEPVNKVREGRPHIVDHLKDREIALVINTTEGAKSIADSIALTGLRG